MLKLKILLAAFLTCIFTLSHLAFAGDGVAMPTPTPAPIVEPPSNFIHGFLQETIATKDYHYSHGINNGNFGPYMQTDLILFKQESAIGLYLGNRVEFLSVAKRPRLAALVNQAPALPNFEEGSAPLCPHCMVRLGLGVNKMQAAGIALSYAILC